MAASEDPFEIPSIIAHRGLSSEAPENTLAAITLAAETGLKWVEVDVKLSSDNHLLLCHDETLHRTTNGAGKVSETSWSELSKLDAGSWFDSKFKGEPLPELDLVLETCQEFNMGINLELKPLSNNIKQFVEALVPIILNHQKLGVRILVSSFNKNIIRELSRTNEQITLGFLLDKKDDFESINNFINEINPASIHIPDERSSKEFVKEMKFFSKQLLVYTVNDPDRAKVLFSIGVEAVFSDLNFLRNTPFQKT